MGAQRRPCPTDGSFSVAVQCIQFVDSLLKPNRGARIKPRDKAENEHDDNRVNCDHPAEVVYADCA